jgi:5-methylcytosine-specific restriction endonuclease McrA
MMLFAGNARALDAAYDAHDFSSWAGLPISHDENEDVIGTTSGPLRIPRVLLLSRYGRIPRATLRLSRRNVFLRDDYTCQYCGGSPALSELNLDHVTPRSRGGPGTWENLVTSCRTCNLRKGSATPEEAGMRLRGKPFCPAWTASAQLATARRRFREWDPFLPQPVAEGAA